RFSGQCIDLVRQSGDCCGNGRSLVALESSPPLIPIHGTPHAPPDRSSPTIGAESNADSKKCPIGTAHRTPIAAASKQRPVKDAERGVSHAAYLVFILPFWPSSFSQPSWAY